MHVNAQNTFIEVLSQRISASLIYYPVMYCYIPSVVSMHSHHQYTKGPVSLTASQIEWVLDFQQCDK